MKIAKLKKLKIQGKYVLAAILQEGDRACDVGDARKEVLVLAGKDVKMIRALCVELKRCKFKTGINYHGLSSFLTAYKRRNCSRNHSGELPSVHDGQ